MIKIISKIIIFFTIILIVILITSYWERHRGYDYIDFDNNVEIARKCYMNDEGLFCKTKDGLVEVKQYGKR